MLDHGIGYCSLINRWALPTYVSDLSRIEDSLLADYCTLWSVQEAACRNSLVLALSRAYGVHVKVRKRIGRRPFCLLPIAHTTMDGLFSLSPRTPIVIPLIFPYSRPPTALF